MYTEKDKARRETWLAVEEKMKQVLAEYRKLDHEAQKPVAENWMLWLRETAHVQAMLWDDPLNPEVY